MVGGQDTPAFTIRTRPSPEVVPGRAEQVRRSARERFGRSKAQRDSEALGRRLVGRRGRSVSGGGSLGGSAGVSGGGPQMPGADGAFPAWNGSDTSAGRVSDSWMDS